MDYLVDVCKAALSCRNQNGTIHDCLSLIEDQVPLHSAYVAEWVWWASTMENWNCEHFRTHAWWPVVFVAVTCVLVAGMALAYFQQCRTARLTAELVAEREEKRKKKTLEMPLRDMTEPYSG